jgi:hypothetical protein
VAARLFGEIELAEDAAGLRDPLAQLRDIAHKFSVLEGLRITPSSFTGAATDHMRAALPRQGKNRQWCDLI